jgi:hypothetical protein
VGFGEAGEPTFRYIMVCSGIAHLALGISKGEGLRSSWIVGLRLSPERGRG